MSYEGIGQWQEATLLRQADDRARRRADRRNEEGGSGASTVFARTRTASSYPTLGAKFFACETMDLLGPESEGAAATKTGIGDTFFAMLPRGAAVPESGSEVVGTRVAHRWVIVA